MMHLEWTFYIIQLFNRIVTAVLTGMTSYHSITALVSQQLTQPQTCVLWWQELLQKDAVQESMLALTWGLVHC